MQTRFDFRGLECFVAVLEECSLLKASQRLYLAQPALTRRMRALEDALGFELLRRSSKGVVPTQAGPATARKYRLCSAAINKRHSVLEAT